jgi:hypothetical protein
VPGEFSRPPGRSGVITYNPTLTHVASVRVLVQDGSSHGSCSLRITPQGCCVWGFAVRDLLTTTYLMMYASFADAVERECSFRRDRTHKMDTD